MARIIIAVVLFYFPLLTQAQEKLPEAPKPKSHAVFYIGTAALAAAKSFDAIETARDQRNGWKENNPLFGAHPSTARLAGVNAGVFALESLMFRATENSHRSWVRWIGRGYITFAVEEHLRYGTCGSFGPEHWRQATACHWSAPF